MDTHCLATCQRIPHTPTQPVQGTRACTKGRTVFNCGVYLEPQHTHAHTHTHTHTHGKAAPNRIKLKIDWPLLEELFLEATFF